MNYSLDYIFKHRRGNRSPERKLFERFIPLNFILKIFSPFPTYVFLNLGIHPDSITLLSMVFILFGSGYILSGHNLFGSIFLLIFLFLDEVDGDMARCAGPSNYGEILDSFGADLFYACVPVSFGYFLFNRSLNVGQITSGHFLLIGAFASITFLAYRLIKAKKQKFANVQTPEKSYDKLILNKSQRNSLLKYALKIISFFRHTLIRNNFFGEPGMILWFFILSLFRAYNLLGIYLICILAYNLIYLTIDFASAIAYFRASRTSPHE